MLDSPNPEHQSINNFDVHNYGESTIPDSINDKSLECYPYFDGINPEPQV